MKNEIRNPRNRVAIAVICALIGIWAFAIITSYRDTKQDIYAPSAQLKPIGNAPVRSIAPSSGNATPFSSTAPMISGGAVRRYAYYGHSSMSATSGMNNTSVSGGYKVYTTSSATYHSYGASGGSGGGMYASTGKKTSSSPGASYGGVSVSMPTIAMSNSRLTKSSSDITQTRLAAPGRRRILENGDGEYDGEYNESTRKWWNVDAEDWLTNPWEGVTKIEGGLTYRYDGSDWVPVENQSNPDSPIGDVPWILLLLLMVVYVVVKSVRRKMYEQE